MYEVYQNGKCCLQYVLKYMYYKATRRKDLRELELEIVQVVVLLTLFRQKPREHKCATLIRPDDGAVTARFNLDGELAETHRERHGPRCAQNELIASPKLVVRVRAPREHFTISGECHRVHLT